MADDFLATAKTMFVDAETLHRNLAYRNACYLYGYVTECFLKKVLEAAGNSLKKTHDLTYLGELVEAVRVAATSQVSHHLAPPISSPMTKDKHWDPIYRYDGRHWGETACRQYQREAKDNYDKLLEMELDGVIREMQRDGVT